MSSKWLEISSDRESNPFAERISSNACSTSSFGSLIRSVHRQTPMFPLQLWDVYQRKVDNEDRTNN